MKATRNSSDEDSESRKSAEHSMSRLSRFFVTDVARAQILGWMVKALSNKRVVEKMGGNNSHMVLEHPWIFQFIDIIYVGTIFKLSHLIGLCGRGINVYTLCVSYFAIMFSTRLSFDVYTCISGASGILHLMAFCFYGMGVFVMTVNISSHLKHGASADDVVHSHTSPISSYGTALTGSVSYGSCERSIDYDTAFAVAFIFTRMVLIVMYGLYFYVFHESNQVGLAPDLALFAKGLRLSDLTRDEDAEGVKEFHRASIDSRAHSVDHFRPGAERPASSAASTHSAENPLQSALSGLATPPPVPRAQRTHRTSFVMRVTNKYGEQAVKLHFTRIFVLKVAPVILSSLAMTAMFAGVTPVIVLPVVALIEMIGDFLPSYFIHHAADWKELVPSRHFLEERLGLFFMLVLGEVVLGFSAVNYYSERIGRVFKVLLFSFFSIFVVGMQYFEPLQCYTKPEGPHPLDIQQLNPVYVWLVGLTSFFMLVAGNGMVELYGQVAENDLISADVDIEYQKEKVANGLGTVTILMILIKILDKVYYRERLLPDPFFSWLDGFYKKAEVEHRSRAPSYAPKPDAARQASNADSDRLSNDSDFGPGQVLSNQGSAQDRGALSSAQRSQASAPNSVVPEESPEEVEGTMRVVPKSEVAMGIRRIRPLTLLRCCVALVQYLLWPVKGIAVEDYMTCYAALIVLPSLVEVILEIRNFFKKHREDALGLHESGSTGKLADSGVE